MKRVRSIEGISFDVNPLFVAEEFSPDSTMSEAVPAADGSRIVYIVPVVTPYITITSQNYGIITEENRDALMTLWNDIGAEYTITYTDGTTDIARMAHEREEEFVFNAFWEGSCWYTGTIPMEKIK